MPKIAHLDLAMRRRTDVSGGIPVHVFVEQEIPDLGIITDEAGNPTRGGLIGYSLAYILMAGVIGYFFLVV